MVEIEDLRGPRRRTAGFVSWPFVAVEVDMLAVVRSSACRT